VFEMFYLDKKNTAIIPGPAPRTTDNLPTRRHKTVNVSKVTILLYYPDSALARQTNTCANNIS